MPTLEKFAESYTQLLVAAWSDETFARRLISHPREAADAVGLEIPPDVAVRVVEPTKTQDDSLADYHRQFEAGVAAGTVELIVPSAPVTELQDLNRDDPAGIAAGGACCCCCPCCCSV